MSVTSWEAFTYRLSLLAVTGWADAGMAATLIHSGGSLWSASPNLLTALAILIHVRKMNRAAQAAMATHKAG